MRRALLALLLASCACSREAAPAPAPRPAPEAKGPVALFIGDSLTAGYGVEPEQAWPALVGAQWARRGSPWRARNAGISGATSAGAKEQAAWALTPDVKLVFVCIGANDGLRGLPLAETRRNVDALLSELRQDGRAVVLAGMRLPPNYGAQYADGFAAIFPALAKKHRVPLMPFLLEGVAAAPALTQADGLHPNAEGHRLIAAAVLAFLDARGLPR